MVVNTGATGKDSGCTEQDQDMPKTDHVLHKMSTKGNACLKPSIFFNFFLLTLLCGAGFYISYNRQKYCKMEVEYGKIEMQLKGLNYEVKSCKVYPIETKPPNSESLQDDKVKTVSSSPRSLGQKPEFPKTGSPRPSELESSKTGSSPPRDFGSSESKSPRPSEPESSNTRSPPTRQPGSSVTRSFRPRKPGSSKTRSPLFSDLGFHKTRSPRPSKLGSPRTRSSPSSEPGSFKTTSSRPSKPISSKTRNPRLDEPASSQPESVDAKPVDENLFLNDPGEMISLWSILHRDYEIAMPMPSAKRTEKESGSK